MDEKPHRADWMMEIGTWAIPTPAWTRIGPFQRGRRKQPRSGDGASEKQADKIGDEAFAAPRRAPGSFDKDPERRPCSSFVDPRQVLGRIRPAGRSRASGTMSRLRRRITSARQGARACRSWATGATSSRSRTRGRASRAASHLRAALPLSALRRCVHSRATRRRAPAPLRRGRDRLGSVPVRGRATDQPPDSRSARRSG
jgi:hypothetical protein